MRFRFLAVMGPGDGMNAIAGRAAQAGLRPVAADPDFHLWVDTTCPMVTGGGSAAVGFLIERSTGVRQRALPVPLPADEQLMKLFWGAYVLFARQPDGSRRIVRDPSGAVAAYQCLEGEIRLCASDAETLRLASSQPWRPDLHFVRHFLTFPFLRTVRTGVAGVSEILPGTVTRGGDWSPAWRPWQSVSPARPTAGFEGHAQRLRETALEVIPLLVPEGEDVIVQMSGGLDSSVVAGVLAHVGRPFRAMTFSTLAPDGDERHYAREAARAYGVELLEVVEEKTPLDLAPTAAPNLRPPANPLLQPYHRALSRRFATTGADLLLSGAGGDNVFGYLSTASPAVDAFRRLGPRSSAGVLGDIAAAHGCTFWQAAAAAVRKARQARRPDPWRRDTRFLTGDALLDRIDPHPWLPPPAGELPGKAEHVRSILGIQHFLDLGGTGTATLFPLLAQPLVETCLGVPSWLWLQGGRDRAVARAAFRGIVPELILVRRSKGNLESMLMRSYLAARPRLEELLMDGRLTPHNIIDRDWVGAYLGRPGAPRDADYVRLLEISAVELWLRSFG